MSSVPKPKRKRTYTPEQLEAQKLRMRERRAKAREENPKFDAERAEEERKRYYKQVPDAKKHMRSSKHRKVVKNEEVKDKSVLCDVCDIRLKNPRNYRDHLKTKRHARNLERREEGAEETKE
jgi:FtsZ-interacting cell division protein YlmF